MLPQAILTTLPRNCSADILKKILIIDFLYDESIAAFDINDDPTEKSNRIERLMDAINWGVFHPEDM